MFPFDGSDPDRVLAAGDWHGNTDRAGGVISSAGMREIPVVLQLGDFGFWVPGANTDRYLDILDKLCEQWNVTLLWVDGNHEDFDTLNALPLHDSGVRVIRENIVHLPRGFRWTWHGRRWLALGGAHSVDKHLRKPGRSWWPQEYLSDADLERASAGGPVDMIAAHDCADRVPIPGLVEGAWPEAQIVDAEAHRYLVGTVVDATRPGVLLHGHYHVRYDAIRALPGGGQTAIVGLAGDSSSTRDNTLLLDLRRGDTGEALF
jgi:hypothetical protein